MITLNDDKGLTRIESWDDVITRPGFTIDIDPRTVQLKTIIASYTLQNYVKCGLSTCHQPHGNGYLVVTKDGRETNIGKDCGKKHFSVDFESMRRNFDRNTKNKERRERLGILQNQLPEIKKTVSLMRKDSNGGDWVYRTSRSLIDGSKGLPDCVVSTVRKMIQTGNNSVIIERLSKDSEVELSKLMGKSSPQYVEENVGNLDGIRALLPDYDLRKIFAESIEPGIRKLESANIDLLSSKEVGDLINWANNLEPSIQQAKDSIILGRRLLTQENLKPLTSLLIKKEDKRRWSCFIKQLPLSIES